VSNFAHFRGQRLLVALEQTYYDPIMGVQLLFVLQPLPVELPKTPVTMTWQ
jgi:hypothetical protein